MVMMRLLSAKKVSILNRKSTLTLKLILSYILMSLILIFILIFTARSMINNQFENYIKKNLEKNQKQIVHQLISVYTKEGISPNKDILNNIAQNALEKGFILRVEDMNKKILWCMDSKQCGMMLNNMKNNMSSVYNNFAGNYEEKTYPLKKGDKVYGKIAIGYYGPFYYNNTDIQFLNMLNNTFIFGAILALFLSIALGLLMANRIAKPIKKVIEHTGRIERGNYNEIINSSSSTIEVDCLIRSVNSLASTLNRQMILRKRLAKDYAHEFRTPLASLQTNIEAMIDGIWEPDKKRLESLNEEILRLSRMVGKIDSLVELEDENLVLNKTNFDLVEFIRKIAMNVESDLLEKNLILNIIGNSIEVYADKDKIGQVVINLLSNAIKYSKEYGEITVTVTKNKNIVELSVNDTGIGIEKEDLPYIFEHLYRGDKSRASTTGGSGVGLAVVKTIVEAHEGGIEVVSEIDKGSKFTVTLLI